MNSAPGVSLTIVYRGGVIRRRMNRRGGGVGGGGGPPNAPRARRRMGSQFHATLPSIKPKQSAQKQLTFASSFEALETKLSSQRLKAKVHALATAAENAATVRALTSKLEQKARKEVEAADAIEELKAQQHSATAEIERLRAQLASKDEELGVARSKDIAKTMLYTEIKQDVSWPPGFSEKHAHLPTGRQDSNSTSSFNVFRRSYATGTWAVFCPELHWKTGEPYPTSDMVKWFKGVVDTTRKEHSPEGWGDEKKPSKWLDPVAQREPCKADCPFCPGQEAKIKETVLCVPIDAAHAAWRMKVIMNSKPLVSPVSVASVSTVLASSAGGKPRLVPVLLEDGAGIQVDAVGRHEVVVETRSHNLTLGLMEPEQVLLVLKVWRDRSKAMLKECALHTRFVQIYKNHGPAAGASQPHAHSQLVGLGMIPNEMARLAGRNKQPP